MLVAVACAVEAPPPGGPVDDIPPNIVGKVPRADSAGVAPESRISITFSEDMTRTGVERLLQLQPPIEIGEVRWKGRTVVVRPLEPLHPDTTYFVTLRAGFRDNHRVPSDIGIEWAFATSAAIDSGTISGRIYFRREPTKKGVVRCFVLPVDSGFAPEAERPDREAVTDDNGDYELRYLPNRGNFLVVWAFEDANQNRTFSPENEAGITLRDTVVLTPGAPFASGVDVFIVDPTEPAEVAGIAVNHSGLDTFVVSVGLFADTVDTPVYLTRCDTTGAYKFKNVLMGTYLLRGFVDVVPDSVCGYFPCFADTSRQCAEPCAVYPDTLTVVPGDEVALDTLWIELAATKED
jgi:hypothetical protein